VFLAIFNASCAAALVIATVEGKLKGLGWLITLLFSIAGLFLLLAIVTTFRPTDEQLRAQREEKKKTLRRTLRNLKREYRQTHHVASQFQLGAEYYIQHTTAADADLIHEIIEEEGEKE